MFQDSVILERFVVIEGVDGAGTSTQRSRLCQRMKTQGLAVTETFEPTDGPIGRLIRQALQKQVSLSAESLCHLFAADRAMHTRGPDGIVERCRRGEWVVSDRSMFSSYAYQGLSLPLDLIARLNADFPLPQYLFFVDVDIATSRSRREHRGAEPELFETDPIQGAVRHNYHTTLQRLASERPEVQLHWIDGAQAIEIIHHQIWTILGFSPID